MMEKNKRKIKIKMKRQELQKTKDKKWWRCLVSHNKEWCDGDGHKIQLETLNLTS